MSGALIIDSKDAQVIASTAEPTPKLRWAPRIRSPNPYWEAAAYGAFLDPSPVYIEKVLQQLWKVSNQLGNGFSSTTWEWRDVPTEMEAQ